MAADGTAGTKGNPQFLGTGAPATAVDLNLISTWAADNIDRRVADYTARGAISTKYVGMVAQTASDNNVWLCTATAGSGTWIPIGVPMFADMASLTAVLASAPTGTRVYLLDVKTVYRYTGAAWAAWESDWISYVPTLTGFVLGTGGTNQCSYRYEQGSIRVRFLFKFGTSGQTFPTDPKFTLPVTAAAQSHTFEELFGSVSMHDNSGATIPRKGIVYLNATSVTQVIMYLYGTATTGIPANISTTSPWTWAQNDLFRGEFTYIPA